MCKMVGDIDIPLCLTRLSVCSPLTWIALDTPLLVLS